jgi:hypothetical protein
LKERICRRAADAPDPLATRIVRLSARRSNTTHNRPVTNYSIPGQISFHQFVATQLLVSLFLCGVNVSPTGLQALRRQQFLEKAGNG